MPAKARCNANLQPLRNLGGHSELDPPEDLPVKQKKTIQGMLVSVLQSAVSRVGCYIITSGRFHTLAHTMQHALSVN